MSALAGVDVGGSGIRVLLRHGEREYRAGVERAVHVGSSIDPHEVADGILRVLQLALGDARLAPEVVCIGMTGYPGLLEDPEPIARGVIGQLGARAVLVASDALTTHVGALGLRAGTVIAAGTGAIALGTDLADRWNRADGWGHLLGDDGSGAWIGRAGIAAGLRAGDGREGSPALWAHVQATYGDIPSLLDRIYASESPAFELARFVPLVADAARAGDPVALRIWDDAAIRLANTAVAASTGLDPLFSWGGGLFGSRELLLGPFQAAVVARVPAARFQEPLGGSLDGALLLAGRHAETPMTGSGRYLRAYA